MSPCNPRKIIARFPAFRASMFSFRSHVFALAAYGPRQVTTPDDNRDIQAVLICLLLASLTICAGGMASWMGWI